MRTYSLVLIAGTIAGLPVCAQTPPKPEPDVLMLVDGEKLIGHLVESNGATVHFKSDLVGDVTVDWSKVKELHSAQKFAVVTKEAVTQEKGRGRKAVPPDVPQGSISVADEKIEVATSTGTRTIPVADAANVLDVPAFEKAFVQNPNFFRDWTGTITAGAALVQATQTNRTFTESISLVRGIPAEDWLPRRNRTAFDVSSSYGLQSQPGSPSIKTSIYHVDAERDEYFTGSVFAFGQAQFDHNFSQGLDLQQTYVGGIGWSAIKRANETLDLKAGVSYVEQEFSGATKTENLAGSVFDEKFMRKLGKGSTFTQELSVSPSWTNSRALSALGNATLALPVYKQLTFTLGVIENYLNDPPPGFKKNSFQSTAGLTYVLK